MIFFSINDLPLTIELVLRKQALPLVGRITIKERISKHHSGLGAPTGPTIPTE